MKKIWFIINPISGIGKKDILPGLIEDIIDPKKFSYKIKYTARPKHACEIAKQAVENKIDTVAVAGGDGSVNEVAGALIHTATTLAIIPVGSGNGLARHLKIPLKVEAALQVINDSKEIRIDTALMNGFFFLNVAGIGFDAVIAKKFATIGKRGFLSYIKLIGQEYIAHKEKEYVITIDGKEMTHDALFIAIANSSQFGNNAVIAPQANIQDGQLQLCIVKKLPLLSAPLAIYQLFNKKIEQSNYVSCLSGKSFTIQTEKPFCHVDGEPVVIENEINATVDPLSLKVIVQQ